MYFERKKKSSAAFSVRSLARRVGVSPSFLSRALNGKKTLPDELLRKLVSALDIEPELLAPAAPKRKAGSKSSEVSSSVEDWEISGVSGLQVLRSWFYLPILELTTLANFDGTAAMIARRLGLLPAEAEAALRELAAMGLLKFADGRYSKVNKKIRFTSAKSTQLIRRFHDEMLEKSQQELRNATSEDDFQRRLIAGITVSASPEGIQAAKRRLAECLHEIANELTETPGTEVYHLAGQLFPLTKGS